MARQTVSYYGCVSDINASVRLTSNSDGATPLASGVGGIQQPYQQAVSILSIFNRKGSNRNVYIEAIDIDDLSNSDSGGSSQGSIYSLEYITGFSGGQQVDAIPLDSAAAALPSQVKLAFNPDTWSGSGNPVRKQGGSQNAHQSCIPMPMSAGGGFLRQLSVGDLVWSAEGETQSLTLNEGEGVLLEIGIPSNVANYLLEVPAAYSVWIAIGAETYCYSFVATTNGYIPAFALMNGSGSGVAVKVQRITCCRAPVITVSGQTYQVLQTITDAVKGVPLTEIQYDTANDAMPEEIEVRTGAVALLSMPNSLFGPPSGARKDDITGELVITSKHENTAGMFSAGATGLFVAALFNNSDSVYQRRQKNKAPEQESQPIILREGEGIAVIRKLAPGSANSIVSMPRMNMNVTLSVEDTRYWSVTGTFKNSSGANLPDGTPVNAFRVTDEALVGTGTISSGSATVKVNTSSQVYLVVDPTAAGLGGETLCTTALTPT